MAPKALKSAGSALRNKADRLKLVLETSDTALFELLTGTMHVLWALHVGLVLLIHAHITPLESVPGNPMSFSGLMYILLPVWWWVALRLPLGLAVCWFALSGRYKVRWLLSILDAGVWCLVGTLFLLRNPTSPAGTVILVVSVIGFYVTYRLTQAVLPRRFS